MLRQARSPAEAPRLRALLATLIITVIAGAGCLGAKDPSLVEPAARETRPPEPMPSAPTTPSEAPPAAAPADDPPAADRPPTMSRLELSFEGKTQPFVCIPTMLPACGASLASDAERYVPEFDGSPRSVTATLTWDASSPLTQTLVLHIEGVQGCHEECHVMGPSPLTLAVEDIELAEDWELTIHAFVPCQVCGGHDTMIDPGQDFTIGGALIYSRDDSP